MTERAPARAEFVHTRVFDAPRELVFRCMTEPEHLTHFWGCQLASLSPACVLR
jgi:uncharacterized protein YndB with AHSA1/START domain